MKLHDFHNINVHAFNFIQFRRMEYVCKQKIQLQYKYNSSHLFTKHDAALATKALCK